MQVVQRLSVKRNQRGTMYTIGYFLYDTEYATNQYYFGDSAASWTGDSGAYINDVNYVRDQASQHWYLYLTALNENYSWNSMRISEDNQQEMSEGTIIIYPAWFGIRPADQKDSEKLIKNLNGNACNKGDWIFNNATSAVIGTANYTECPFTLGKFRDAFGVEATPDVSKILQNINQKPTVYVYKVTYSDSRAFSALQGWDGVNGSWGSAPAPSDTQTGRWKAVSAHIQQYPSKTGQKNRVTRKAQTGPTLEGIPMIWDSTKNGGTWTW